MRKRASTDGWLHALICSDLHGPFLDRKAYAVFLQACEAGFRGEPWDQVIANGDVCDFSQIAKHDKKIRMIGREYQQEVSLDEELNIVREEIFRPMRKALGRTTKIMMRLGNHEDRFQNVVETNADAVSKMLKTMRRYHSLYLEDLLDLDRYQVSLSYKPIEVLFGTFTVIHGVKSSKNVAAQNLRRFGSGTSGHSHRMGTFTEVMHGKIQGWNESGCLRTIHNVEYLPFSDRPDWSLGFLELHIHKQTGAFHCIPHFIIDYRTWFNGQLLSA